MTLDPSQLPAMAWFVHVARRRSFTKAALEIGVTRAALSQHIKSLERHLNVRLLNRTTRDMSLTEEGQRLFDALQPALTGIARAVTELGEVGSEPTGQIRLSVSRVAARTLLEPHMAEFLTRYPKLRLELVTDDGFTNIVAAGLDAGIRLGESLEDRMVAVAITPPLEMAIVGSPEYLKRYGVPKSPADLIKHNCLSYRFASSGSIDRWSFDTPGSEARTVVYEPQGNAVFNDDDSMMRAALQGIGLIQHIDLCVRPHLESGALVRVLRNLCQPFPGFYLYVPSRAQMPAKTRALVDFLVEQRKKLARRYRPRSGVKRLSD